MLRVTEGCGVLFRLRSLLKSRRSPASSRRYASSAASSGIDDDDAGGAWRDDGRRRVAEEDETDEGRRDGSSSSWPDAGRAAVTIPSGASSAREIVRGSGVTTTALRECGRCCCCGRRAPALAGRGGRCCCGSAEVPRRKDSGGTGECGICTDGAKETPRPLRSALTRPPSPLEALLRSVTESAACFGG